MKKDVKKTISIILNSMIVICTVLATIMMFTGLKFSQGTEAVLESTKLGMFRFFTVDSNILMGITSLAYLIEIVRNKNISRQLYLTKLASTTAVTLTFLVVVLYLGPISKGGMISMFRNSNLFFHLITPLLSIISFTLTEKYNAKSVKDSFVGLIPTAIYGIYYLGNIILHLEDGKVSPRYDWYWFVQNGISSVFIVIPIIFTLTYFISFSLWKINQK